MKAAKPLDTAHHREYTNASGVINFTGVSILSEVSPMVRERNYKASAYLSPDEVKLLKIAAGYAGISLSEYLRIAAIEKATADKQQRDQSTPNNESEDQQ